MFPDTKLRETSGLIKCFVIFLDFHFNVFQQQQKTGLPELCIFFKQIMHQNSQILCELCKLSNIFEQKFSIY